MTHNIFENLEIKSYKSQILTGITHNKYTLISGPTGCGKSTYIPYILRTSRLIIIEPRRIAVQNLYNTLKNYMDIGYRMRFAHKNVNARCLIMTDGYFINQYLQNKIDCDILILDEVHERSVRCDFIMGILRSSELKMKIVFMSATINYKAIMKYFGKVLYINIRTKGYKLEVHYEDVPCSDYVYESFSKIKHILNVENEKKRTVREIDQIFETTSNENEHRDVLVFLPGEDDINELYKLVRKLPQLKAFKIFSSLADEDQNRIFEKSDLIKVIISTNICETSITIPGIRYVIDCGLMKEKCYNGVNYFGIKAIGKDNASQRTGRCNRMCDGVCYRLYTKQEYEKMQYSMPEILKADLTFVTLAMLALKKDILMFDFMTYPSKVNVKCALKYLCDIKAIKIDSNIRITKYGQRVLQNPFDVHLSHFYEKCKNRELQTVSAIIISMISQENYNFIDRNKFKYKSDLETLVRTFIDYYNCDDRVEYCRTKGISYKAYERAVFLYNKITKKEPICDDEQLLGLEKAFNEAYKHNLAFRQCDSSYKMDANDVNVFIHPSSQLFKTHTKAIVFVDIFATTKNYARIVVQYIE